MKSDAHYPATNTSSAMEHVTHATAAPTGDPSSQDSVPITALVLGLGAAGFFLIMVTYAIMKAVLSERHKVRTTNSRIGHKYLEEGAATPAVTAKNLQKPEMMPQANRSSTQYPPVIDFGAAGNRSAAEMTSSDASIARLTGAKFSSGEQHF